MNLFLSTLPSYLNYKFNQHHPFNQIRLKVTLDLLKNIGAIHENQIIPPRMCNRRGIAAYP